MFWRGGGPRITSGTLGLPGNRADKVSHKRIKAGTGIAPLHGNWGSLVVQATRHTNGFPSRRTNFLKVSLMNCQSIWYLSRCSTLTSNSTLKKSVNMTSRRSNNLLCLSSHSGTVSATTQNVEQAIIRITIKVVQFHKDKPTAEKPS